MRAMESNTLNYMTFYFKDIYNSPIAARSHP